VSNPQWSGVVSWLPNPSGNFIEEEEYIASIIITPEEGYTLQGVDPNIFTINVGGTVVSYSSGTVTITFPATEAAPEEPWEITYELPGNVTAPSQGTAAGRLQLRDFIGWDESMYKVFFNGDDEAFYDDAERYSSGAAHPLHLYSSYVPWTSEERVHFDAMENQLPSGQRIRIWGFQIISGTPRITISGSNGSSEVVKLRLVYDPSRKI